MNERKIVARSADGTRIAAFVTGNGPPLVLVHGTTADHTRWTPLLPALNARFTVYAMDRRGRGASGDTEPYAIEREFEDVAAVVDAIAEPVMLLGHSYGAVCSLEAATRTSHLSRVVLYEPPIPAGGEPLADEASLQRIDGLLAAGDREGALVTFMREIPRLPAPAIEAMRATPAWERRIAAAHTLTREMRIETTYEFDPARLERLDVPTLLLLGGDSPPQFEQIVPVLEKTLPKARVAVMAEQQHNAMDTAPQMFLREVLAFLEEPIRPA